MKENKAITLVALVVTIIVLIILAGVSINLVMGERGILTKAREARNNYQVAANEETVILNGGESTIDSWINGNGGDTEYAPYDTPYMPEGFTHTGSEDWNHGYTIIGNEGTINAGDEFVWVPCVLDQTKVKPGDTVQAFGRFLADGSLYWPESAREVLSDEGTSAGDIRTSVGKYGGFYIAKYEAGIEGIKDNNKLTEPKATDGSEKPLSQPGVGVWNNITRADAMIVAASMIPSSTGCKSALISGECWDTTMQWIKQTTQTNYDINSDGKGNYSSPYPTNGLTTASNTAYAINGIFDMAGNVWEWTTENCAVTEGSKLVSRGGAYGSSATEAPAACRADVSDHWFNGDGFRVVLYKD